MTNPPHGVTNGHLCPHRRITPCLNHGSVMGVHHGIHHSGCATHFNHLHPFGGGVPGVIVKIFLHVFITELDLVPVDHISSGVGVDPRHPVGKPFDDARCSRNGNPVRMNPRSLQLHLVPDRRDTHVQMRITREDGVSACCFAAAHRPVVTADGGIGCRCYRKIGPLRGKRFGRRLSNQRFKIPAVSRRDDGIHPLAAGADVGIHKILTQPGHSVGGLHIIARSGQHLHHVIHKVRPFQHIPLARFHTQNLVLQRIPCGRQAVYIRIHPGNIGLDRHKLRTALISVLFQRPFCTIHHPETALVDIRREGPLTQPLGKASRRIACLQLHLEQAVAGHHIALDKIEVVLIFGVNMGHPSLVIIHPDGRLHPGQKQVCRSVQITDLRIGPKPGCRMKKRTRRRQRPCRTREQKQNDRQY